MKLRRWFQTVSVAALSLGPLGEAKWLCLPVLHCHSCPISVVSCPIGVLGHYISIGVVPILLIGTILFIAALCGRAFCGWVCPFGFLQELLYKIPSPKFELWPPFRYGRYLSLAVLVILVPWIWGTQSPLYFCRLCPAAAIEASIPYAVMSGGFVSSSAVITRFSLAGAILILMVFNLRIFCRTFCPVGAITSLLNPISAFALRHDTQACPQCGQCKIACPVGVDLQEQPRGIVYKAPADCILCLECTDACPTKNGLKGSFAGKIRKGSELSRPSRKDTSPLPPAG
ncbi:MAG: 4Fe-4S binding protein [bacterium]